MNNIGEPLTPLPVFHYHEKIYNNSFNHAFISARSIESDLSKDNVSLSGADLYSMAAAYRQEKNHFIDDKFKVKTSLKPPKNRVQRFLYGLLLVSPFHGDPQYSTRMPNMAGAFPATPLTTHQSNGIYEKLLYNPSPLGDRSDTQVLPQVRDNGRIKREAVPAPRHIRTDRQYRLAVYLNKNAAAGVNLATFGNQQLAIQMLNSIALQPDLLPGLARLALYGSQLYGERMGETLSPVQQKGLVGQTLCQLIYQEDNIALRVAKIFVGNRHITQLAFAALVQSWPYSSAYERDKWLWQEQYEAPEIPMLYLKGLYMMKHESARISQDQTVALDLDNLWVGSLTWTLMHFGARSIALEDPGKLKSTSLPSLIELGIGLVGMFRQGLLSTGVEPTMYLGLLLYYLRIRPDLSLKEVLASDTLEPAFELFKAELERRHFIAQGLYDSFIYYQVNYQRPTWRSRKAAAQELLKQYCGSAQAPIMGLDNIKVNSPAFGLDPVRQLMMRADSDHQCVASGAHIPVLDTFYRQEVDQYAAKIRALDTVLLEAAFMPSDLRDNNFQAEDEEFLQRGTIEWVIPRLTQRRTVHDMFYSNMPVHYPAKPDTSFFLAKSARERRLFALQITGQGYLLRQISLDDRYLSTLRPFMADWPLPESTPQHEFTLLPSNTALYKLSNETLSVFLERYADFHYQSYRLKIYELGYEEMELPLHDIIQSVAGYLIPFYGCASALNAGQLKPAFTECLVDGALVGLPLVFTGIKAGSGLFRAAAIGAGRTLSGPRFSASGQEIYRNVVPATVQIAGGIVATGSQLRLFMDIMGKEVIKSIDPGFAALRSLSILTNGLYLALLGRTTLGLIAWRRNLAKVSADIPKYVVATHTQEYQISYDTDGYMPLAIKVKGVTYPVFEVQNSSLVAVETGERTPDGHLIFAQLDLQNQFGIYKKYYCLNIGGGQCQLNAYAYPDFKIELDAAFPRLAGTHYFWAFSTSSPIHLVVVHPFHLLDFVDKRWVVFEINGRRWAFSRDNATLMPADNIEDWQLSPGKDDGLSPMIESGENDRSFRLRLAPLPHRRKRETVLPRVLDWGWQLANYTLDDDDVSGFPAVIHDDSTLNVQIGEARYLLSPEKNAATFLLRHPRQPAAPTFRVAYRVDKGDFVFASPLESANAHRIGELLRQKINDNPQATQEPHIDILLPPLVNGAFSYGNKMFLKIGERFLHIALFDGVYHTLSMDEGDTEGKPWTLRYELFTGSFDIFDARLSVKSTSTYDGIVGALSRFERLAARTFNKSAYPSLAALCRPEYPALNISSASGLSLHTRLRQVALLLRLDATRRAELLHASSVALSTFRMNSTLPDDWLMNFRPLALWSTLVKMVAACLGHQDKEGLWATRPLAWIKNSSWPFPPPVVIAQGPDLRIFILNKEGTASQGMHPEKDSVIQLFPDGVEAVPLVSEDGFRRWLPPYEEIQPTVVTKFLLSETQQPVFWVDASNQTWAQTPNGVKTRLYRQNNLHPISDIIVSPDGGTVVMMVERTSLRQRALFYHLAYMGSPAVRGEISHYGEAILSGPFIPGRAWWVNNRGDLFAPWEKHWAFMDEDHPHWDTPEGYQPDFVSPDQRFLGYVKRDAIMHDQEILLIDITCDKSLLLRRSQPVTNKGYGLGKMVSVAFSALNALVAVGFADGYIEIYRIRQEEHADKAFSLGHVNLPHGKYVLSGVDYLKPKQMVMKFNNAFDQLLVFHDIGEFRTDLKGNGTYAISEIYLADRKLH